MTYTLPCVLMRGGTSRGPFFRSDWLPDEPDERDKVLLQAMGSPHELQIDGLGGGHSLTSKVAIVSRSARGDCDVDYLFAQVSVNEKRVDTRPNCGNMLAGVGPFAIEQGLVAATEGTTLVRVFNVNTNSRIDVQVQTPHGHVAYDGDARIDGVDGTAAPVRLNFLDAWGSVTGSVFPTGKTQDTIQGVDVTCIDAAQVMVLMRAADFGLQGTESADELDSNTALRTALESIRREAGYRMGLGDVSSSVLPKPVLIAPGVSPGSIQSRYFTPARCHRSHAATGAIGVAAATVLAGTVAFDSRLAADASHVFRLEVLHPSGAIQVEIEKSAGTGDGSKGIKRASLIRTARKIFDGTLHLRT